MHKFKLTKIEPITSHVIQLTLTKQSHKPFQYEAGQYAALSYRLNGKKSPSRCFSMISAPTQDGNAIQFAIKVEGPYTQRLSLVPLGTDFTIQGPYGDFTINSQYDRQVVMLAAGIGITPFIAMLRRLSELRQSTRVLVLYAVHAPQDAAFIKELLQLTKINSNIDLHFITHSSEMFAFPEAKVMRGKLDDDLLTQVITEFSAGTSYFICGPPNFMDAMISILNRNDVPQDRILTEAFSQKKLSRGAIGTKIPKFIYATSAAGVMIGTGALVVGNVLASGMTHAATYKTSTVQVTTTTFAQSSTSSDTSPSTSTEPMTQTYQPPQSSVS